jgi:hypothetical protein
LYAFLMSRNRANNVFCSPNAFIISVVNSAKLPVHLLFHQNSYCISENFLFFSSHKDMRTFIIRSNTLHTCDAKDIGLPFILFLQIKNTYFFPVVWEHSCY